MPPTTNATITAAAAAAASAAAAATASTNLLLGRHEALLATIAKEQEQLIEDVRLIRESLAETRGERRVALWLAGAIGGGSGLLASFAHLFNSKP
jgi:hypothetical protein